MKNRKNAMGKLYIELVSADITAVLNEAGNQSLYLYDVNLKDAFTSRFHVSQQDLRMLEQICAKRGDKITILSDSRISGQVAAAIRRPVFLLGIIFFVFLLL